MNGHAKHTPIRFLGHRAAANARQRAAVSSTAVRIRHDPSKRLKAIQIRLDFSPLSTVQGEERLNFAVSIGGQ